MDVIRIFLENNYKIQTISLVRKRFKHISFITIRVQWSRFLCYKIECIVLELPGLPATEVAVRVHVDQKLSKMNSVFGLINWVHWTRFVSVETEFVGLSFKAYKPSPKNSVYMPRNRVLWTRFASLETESKGLGFIYSTCRSSTHSKNKHIVSKIHSSLSFPLTLGLSLTLWLSS